MRRCAPEIIPLQSRDDGPVLFKGTFSVSGLDQPGSVLKPERNKRTHLSSVLSRNELDRDYPYNRRLFKRIAHGWYQINPRLAIRRRAQGVESWHPVLEALNLRLVHEHAHPDQWGIARTLWRTHSRRTHRPVFIA